MSGQAGKITSHTQLDVYQRAFGAAMEIFRATKAFSADERYSLTDQNRRSSRSVAANVAEAWRKRRYEAAIASKLSDCEAEAAETQSWIQFAVDCGYLDRATAAILYRHYDAILGMLVTIIANPEPWLLPLRHRHR